MLKKISRYFKAPIPDARELDNKKLDLALLDVPSYFSLTYLVPVPEPLSVGVLVSLSAKLQLLRYPVPALRYVAKLSQPK